MAARPKKWPQAVDELLPHKLFRLAVEHPDLTFSEYLRNPTVPSDGYRKITYKEAANAVHAIAWWIEDNVGKPKKDDGSETMVYMGPNDLCYSILVLGSVMVGYKMLFPTPRYGAEAITTLISSANGTIMLTPSTPFPVVSKVLARRPMELYKTPPIEHFLSSQSSPYPYTKSFQSSKNEPLVCLHTSGTTGFPKPIIWTHDWANSVAAGHCVPAPPGYGREDGMFFGPQVRLMTMFPQFHASGIIGGLFFQLLTGTTVVHAPIAATPDRTISQLLDVLDMLGEDGRIDALATPPLYLEYLGANAGLLDRLRKVVKMVLWSGGDLSHTAGNAIAAKMQISNNMASTEMGLWHSLRKLGHGSKGTLDDEWHYLIFHPAFNIRFDIVFEGKEATIYEAVMVKNEGNGAWVQPIFKIYTDVREITLGDLFTQHPRNPELWKHYGRADDLLVFQTGESFHPGPAERRITSHTGVADALLVGTGQLKASLILRLKEGAALDDVWKVVEDVNKDSPLYARVARHMILTVTKPFVKTAKGSVEKKVILDLYKKDLDILYKTDSNLLV